MSVACFAAEVALAAPPAAVAAVDLRVAGLGEGWAAHSFTRGNWVRPIAGESAAGTLEPLQVVAGVAGETADGAQEEALAAGHLGARRGHDVVALGLDANWVLTRPLGVVLAGAAQRARLDFMEWVLRML